MRIGRGWQLFLGLTVAFIVAVIIGVYAAEFKPTGRGVGNAAYLFFDHLPWLPFAAAFFALILSSLTRRVACYIDKENQRVLRMDFAARVSHWLTALPAIVALFSGLSLGVFFIPRLLPDGQATAIVFNIHFVAVVFLLVGFFFLIGNWILSPRRLAAFIPFMGGKKNPISEGVIFYLHKARLTKRTVNPDKFEGSEQLAFLMAITTLMPLVISGLFKVAARFYEFPEELSYFMNVVHELFTLVLVFYLVMHVPLVTVPWEWPNFKAMTGHGKGGGGYVPLDYAREENPEWVRHLEDEGKAK
jgi:cytochrome b subunit of formate dehydrogenase